ncbi:MAG: hypothetical protein C0434_17645 [Xanthomonadaceae bacterium]|nr:hypothetical protein [Xanthomonadaceae bacterium]
MRSVNALLGRGRMLEIAAHIVATEGAGALTVRRLARDLGTSTMSLYSHFAGKDELIEATADEFVIRFADALRAVPVTDDALHDFVRMSNRYRSISLENRDLYRVALASGRLSLAHDTPHGIRDLFEYCVVAVGRCIAEGSLTVAEPRDGLMVFWTAVHGQVGLEMEQVFQSVEAAQHAWETCFAAVLVGLGAQPAVATALLNQTRQAPA